MTPVGNGTGYIKLEKRLVLLAWLNSLFGYKSNQELLADGKQADEGFDPYGRSFVYHRLVGRGSQLLLQEGGHLRHGRSSVAVSPDQGGRWIQAVGLVAAQVVHQHFVRQFPDHEPVFPRAR